MKITQRVTRTKRPSLEIAAGIAAKINVGADLCASEPADLHAHSYAYSRIRCRAQEDSDANANDVAGNAAELENDVEKVPENNVANANNFAIRNTGVAAGAPPPPNTQQEFSPSVKRRAAVCRFCSVPPLCNFCIADCSGKFCICNASHRTGYDDV